MKTANIILFLVLLNAGSTLLLDSGVAGDWGISPNVGADKSVDELDETAKSLNPAGGGGDTLFGLYNTAANTFRAMADFAFAGPRLLANVGIPSFITSFLFSVIYILVGFDLYYAFTNRRLDG